MAKHTLAMYSPTSSGTCYHRNGTSLVTMKSTKVQTLGVVALHATTDCTDDASIVGLGPLNWAIV